MTLAKMYRCAKIAVAVEVAMVLFLVICWLMRDGKPNPVQSVPVIEDHGTGVRIETKAGNIIEFGDEDGVRSRAGSSRPGSGEFGRSLRPVRPIGGYHRWFDWSSSGRDDGTGVVPPEWRSGDI